MKTRTRSVRSRTAAVCIDGCLVPAASASVSIDDWGFRYGWGAFETLRVHRRRPLFVDRHLTRLWATAQVLHLGDEDCQPSWLKEIQQTIKRAKLEDGIINLYWTRGAPPGFAGRRIVCARTTGTVRAPVSRPVRLWTAPWRVEATMPAVGAKTLSYFANMFASICAAHEGFDGALILNAERHIADGSTFSIFLVEGDRLSTPSEAAGALPGVTRGLIIEAATDLGVRVSQRRIPVRRLLEADALFITSALRGIAVVSGVDDHRLSATAGTPAGKLMARLRSRYARAIAACLKSTPPAF